MSLSQATYRLFLPCDSRKSCFTARFTLSLQCHLFGFHPVPSLLSATKAKLCEHLQLLLSLCLTLPPTSAVPQGPPAPSLFSQLLVSPLPCGQGSGSLLFLELQLHEGARGQGLPAPKPQRLHSCSPGRTGTGSAGFQPRDSREEAPEIPGLKGGCRAEHRDRAEGILCYSPAPGNDPSYVSAIKKDKLNKTRGSEEWERQGWKSQIPTAFTTSSLFPRPRRKQGRHGSGIRAGVAEGSKFPGQSTEQGKQKTQENPGNLLSALAHFLGMFYLFVCFPETSVLRIQDFP